MRQKTILFLTILTTIFLLLITNVQAYGLKAYYTFDSTYLNQSNDSVNAQHLTSSNGGAYCMNSITGIKGNALQWGGCASPYPPSYNSTLKYSVSTYSTNFWIRNLTVTNTETLFSISNSTTIVSIDRYSTPPSGLKYYNKGIIKLLDTTIGTTVNSWLMITLIHQGENCYLYVNGILKASNTSCDMIPFQATKLNFYMPYISIDELSIYDYPLTQEQITTLYNNGLGLNYAETQSLANQITTDSNFTVTIDTVNSKYSNGIHLTYPYGIPLQSYAITITTAANNGSYVGVVCNYTNTQVFNDQFEYTNITQNGWLGGCGNYWSNGIYQGDTGLSMYINGSACSVAYKVVPEFSFANSQTFTYNMYPTQSGRFKVALNNFYNTAPVVQVLYDYNTTSDEICIYRSAYTTDQLIFCKPYNVTVDGNLYTRIKVENVLTNTYTVDLATDKTDYTLSGALNVLSGTYSAPETISFLFIETSNGFESWLDNLNITQEPNYPRLTPVNFPYYQGCPYGSYIGYVTARIYYQSQNITAWNNYKDLQILTRTVEQQRTDTVSSQNLFNPFTINDPTANRGMSEESKLVVGIGIVLVVLILSAILVGIFTRNTGATLIVAGFASLITMILLALPIIGWLPVEIVILLGIIDILIIAVGFKQIFFQTDG